MFFHALKNGSLQTSSEEKIGETKCEINRFEGINRRKENLFYYRDEIKFLIGL
jgi:hypothetical protein